MTFAEVVLAVAIGEIIAEGVCTGIRILAAKQEHRLWCNDPHCPCRAERVYEDRKFTPVAAEPWTYCLLCGSLGQEGHAPTCPKKATNA